MEKMLIFGGTEDGRELAETLSKNSKWRITLSVATAFGKKMVQTDQLTVIVGRLSVEEMKTLMKDYAVIIDATHPYAVEVSKNIAAAAGDRPVLRLVRENSDMGTSIMVDSIEEACQHCREGNILAATGSKQIAEYKGYLDRVYARVLPTEASVNLCYEAGLPDEQIIKHFGRNSVAENKALIEKYKIKNLITKDGGSRGGFAEKKQAAEEAGIAFIVIRRPEETGYSMTQLINHLGGKE